VRNLLIYIKRNKNKISLQIFYSSLLSLSFSCICSWAKRSRSIVFRFLLPVFRPRLGASVPGTVVSLVVPTNGWVVVLVRETTRQHQALVQVLSWRAARAGRSRSWSGGRQRCWSRSRGWRRWCFIETRFRLLNNSSS
jgi:hypothetical protein